MNNVRNHKDSFLFLIFIVLLTGCSLPGSITSSPTVDSYSILTAAAATASFRLTGLAAQSSPTAFSTGTDTPSPAPTPIILPTSISTIVPIKGIVSANANVRRLPIKSKENDIGGVLLGQQVGVIGRNEAATWLYIIFSESLTGTGWVTAKAITLSSEMGILPILIFPNGLEAQSVMIPPFLYEVQGTPMPPSTPPAGWEKFGILIQPANVRLGPSIGFLTIGVLKVGEVVTFRGRIAENTWVQIDYPSGPEGKGWILSSLVQANDGYGSLPFFNVLGTAETPKPELTEVPPGFDTTPEALATIPVTNIPTAEVSKGNGADGVVTNQINVRAGPAQTYPSYGLLNPQDKVFVTGVTLNNYWYQIQYPGSPNSYAWVAVQFIRIIGDGRKIPYFNNEGTPIPPT